MLQYGTEGLRERAGLGERLRASLLCSARGYRQRRFAACRVDPLAKDALTDWVVVSIAVVSLILLLTTEIDTLWIILGAALISLSASALGVIARIA